MEIASPLLCSFDPQDPETKQVELTCKTLFLLNVATTDRLASYGGQVETTQAGVVGLNSGFASGN